MVAKLQERAMKELKLPPAEIVVRPLRPEDLGLSTAEWTFSLTSGAWATAVNNVSIGDNRFIGINGILVEESGEMAGTQIKITREGQDVRYWHIQGVNYLQDSMIFFDDPVTMGQNTALTIKIYARATDTDFQCCFLGAVAEKRGVLVA
jgi:hypothetical protein